MITTTTRRASRRSALAFAALAGITFDVHILVRDDGTGKLAATYTATPISNNQTETFRFNSPVTETKRVKIAKGMAKVRVDVKDVSAIAQAPELSLTTVELGPVEDGKRTIRAVIRGPVAEFTGEAGAVPARIRLTLPGTVLQSSGKQESRRSVGWTAPIAQYFSKDGIPIEATYETRGAGGTGRDEAGG